MNVLITGITGSGGSYLAEYLLSIGVDVHGICRWHSTSTMSNIEKIKNKIKIYECDLLDFPSIIRTLNIVKPERIFHLAAYANVRKCFDTPLSVVNNNIMGTANLLEAVRMVCPQSVLQMCSTSEVYGNPETFPMREDHPTKPVNPYAVSKLAQESLAYSYFKSWGLRVIITRMFAYINPRRSDLFATSFAIQAVKVNKGLQDCIYHGNLDSIRTLIDVRDAMESYWVASEKCAYGEAYNIGGNDVLSVGDFLDILCNKTGAIKRLDVNLLRPVDVTKQIPDTSKFNSISNWKPRYTLNESIDFLLEECNEVINYSTRN